MKNPTIKDISRESGFSLGTVERALNNRGRIKEETKIKIIQKANELGYQANTIARKLALRKKFKILVIAPSQPDYFWNDVISGVKIIEKELSEFGIQLVHFYYNTSNYDSHPELLDIMMNEKVHGIVMSAVRLKETEEIVAYAAENQIPLITFNEDIINKNRLMYYGPNKELSGRMAGEILAKFIGREGNVGILVNTNALYTFTQRMQGFCGLMYKHYPKINIINTYTYSKGKEKEMLQNIINSSIQLKGIYVMDGTGGGNIGSALKEIGCSGISVVAHESSDVAEALLKEEYIDALICEEKVCQGYYPVKLMHEYLVSGILPEQREMYSNINIIIRENIEFIKHNRFGTGYK